MRRGTIKCIAYIAAVLFWIVGVILIGFGILAASPDNKARAVAEIVVGSLVCISALVVLIAIREKHHIDVSYAPIERGE